MEKTLETIFYDNRKWSIMAKDYEDYALVITTYGVVDGKMTTSEKRVCGKNKNKKNETTAFEQAVKEIEAKWKEKKDSVNKEILPMLAYDYEKSKKHIRFPAYVQPKLDGNRCLGNKSKLYSRSGKKWELDNTNIMKDLKLIKEKIIFDGELYIHGGSFEDLGVLRKKHLGKADTVALNKIQYHIYDIISDSPFHERLEKLKSIFKKYNFSNLKLVEVEIVDNFEAINEYHKLKTSENYEGIMIRNKNGLYKRDKRSNDLLKYKSWKDSEFVITGYSAEYDHLHDPDIPLVVWQCKTDDGKLFNVRPKGNVCEREAVYLKADTYIGSKLWVKYFELTEENIPRFPTTKTDSVKTYIRDIID